MPQQQSQVPTPPTFDPTLLKHSLVDVVSHPKGDLVIQAGLSGDLGLIRVHRNTLEAHSPALRAMIGPKFAEGRKSLDENDPLILPDDDYTGVLTFVQALHLKIRDLDYSQVIKVAIIADKYGCAPEVLHVLLKPQWLAFLDNGQISYESLDGINTMDAIHLAALADDSALFQRATKCEILNRRDLGASSNSDNETSEFLEALFARSIEDEIAKVLKTELDLIHENWETFIQYTLDQHSNINGYGCDGVRRAMGELSLCLWQICGGASRRITDTMFDLGSIWSMMNDTEQRMSSWRCPSRQQCAEWESSTERGCSAEICVGDVETFLRREVSGSKSRLLGLCLQCFREGSELGGHCDHISPGW